MYTGKRDMPSTPQEEMEDEIEMQLDLLRRYENNLQTLLPKQEANEVRKAMINFLVEQL
jgi:hypothetical protein